MAHYAPAAQYYDLLYAKIRDYVTDTRALQELFAHAELPVKRVFDVACGTGRQAELLIEAGLSVDGIDLEAEFIRIANQRAPSGNFREANMMDFEVAEPYDALLCLFGSVGYVLTEEALHSTLDCMARATRPGGLLILEPWFEPGAMSDNHTTMSTAETERVSVCRMSRTVLHGELSRIEFNYLIAERGEVQHFTEVHELGLFSRDMMQSAFTAAGFRAEYDANGLMGRGLYIAHRGGLTR